MLPFSDWKKDHFPSKCRHKIMSFLVLKLLLMSLRNLFRHVLDTLKYVSDHCIVPRWMGAGVRCGQVDTTGKMSFFDIFCEFEKKKPSLCNRPLL